jgi:hypothetical protein
MDFGREHAHNFLPGVAKVRGEADVRRTYARILIFYEGNGMTIKLLPSGCYRTIPILEDTILPNYTLSNKRGSL